MVCCTAIALGSAFFVVVTSLHLLLFLVPLLSNIISWSLRSHDARVNISVHYQTIFIGCYGIISKFMVVDNNSPLSALPPQGVGRDSQQSHNLIFYLFVWLPSVAPAPSSYTWFPGSWPACGNSLKLSDKSFPQPTLHLHIPAQVL